MCLYAIAPARVGRSRAQINFMPPAWQDEPVIVVDDSTTLSVFRDDNGKNRLSVVSVEYLYINKRNPNDFESIQTFESPNVEGPQSIVIKAFYPDGTVWESNSADISIFPVVYDNIFQTDDVARRVIVPHYVEGMVIRLERRRELFRPEFMNCEYFRQEYPIINKRIALSWPRDYSIIHCVKNAEGLQQIDTATVDNGRRIEFIVKASMLGKIQKTNRIKNPEEWYAGFHFGIPPEGKRSYSWAQLGDHYLDVVGSFVSRFAENSEVGQFNKRPVLRFGYFTGLCFATALGTLLCQLVECAFFHPPVAPNSWRKKAMAIARKWPRF